MIVLIDTPSVDVQETPEEVSSWVAGWHPVIFRFQRQDFAIGSGDLIVNPGSGGSTQITIAGETISELEVGQFIYVSYANIAATYEVLEVSFGGGDTIIIIDSPAPLFSPGSGGYINLITARSFYMIEVNVFTFDESGADTDITDAYAQFRPSNDAGDIKADIQSWLQLALSADNTYEYDAINEFALGLGVAYNIEVREYWKEVGYGEFESLTESADFGVVNAVKQVGDKWGQNMAEFFMYEPAGGEVQTNTFGKFLTKFTTPTYFLGMPYDISFIKTAIIGGSNPIFRIEIGYNINGDIVHLLSSELTLPESETISGVVRMKLSGSYPTTTHRLEVALYQIEFVEGNRISEWKSILVDHCEYRNTEYLAWLNPHGGFDYWLFINGADYSATTSNENTFERNIENLEDADARRQTIKKDIQESIYLGVQGISNQTAQEMSPLLSSPKIYRYLGLNEDGEHKWQVVRVAQGGFSIYKSSETKSEILLTLIPPQLYNQQQ
jgi:hypothetical protein